jgi:hypothetical protein
VPRERAENATFGLEVRVDRVVEGLFAARREPHQHAEAVFRVRLALRETLDDEALDAYAHRPRRLLLHQ